MLAETQIIHQPTIPVLDAANHYLRVSSIPSSNSKIDDVLLDPVVAAPTLSSSVSSPTSATGCGGFGGVSIFTDALVSDSRLDSVCQFYQFDFLLFLLGFIELL